MGFILDLFAGIPLNAVLRERIAAFERQTVALEQEVAATHEENARLKDRIAELEQQIASQPQAEEFVEHYGALFKKRPSGDYHRAVFCLECHNPMSSLEKMLPYRCARCKISVDFTGHQFDQVFAELPRS